MNTGIKLRQTLRRWTTTFLLTGLIGSGIAASAYDSPTFDSNVFSADGIFLSASEKQSLLEALTALAVNFPSSRQVDSDLQEKAIGIALQINPLHYPSRNAHEALQMGKSPEKTEYFETLSAVSEALWRTSSTLLTSPAEPEEIRLAPYLMELSLLIHPEPPADRMESFALRTSGRKLGWNRFLELDPSKNPSTRRSQMLLLEASDLLRETLRETSRGENPTSPDPPTMTASKGASTEAPMKRLSVPGSTPPMTDPTSEEFEPIQLQIPTIRTVTAISTASIFGTVELTVRLPTSELEESLFPFLSREDPSDYPQLPLLGEFRGISLENLEIPTSEATRRNLSWPGQVLGMVGFRTDSVLPGPRRLCKASGLLPALAALEAALGDKELNPDFVLAGSITEVGAIPTLDAELKDFVSAIPEVAPPYLLVPESSLDELILYLQVSQNLGALFAKEWVSYDSTDSAISTLTSGTDTGLTEASRSFDEIEAVSERMPLVELARNSKVQERLSAILETYPRHLSARAMLEFGTRPIPESVQLEATANQIDDIVSPFLQLQNAPDDLNTLRGLTEDAQTELFRMRSNLPTELVDFHDRSFEAIEAAEAYLGLTNTTTSLATQKLREVREALDSWESAREDLFETF